MSDYAKCPLCGGEVKTTYLPRKTIMCMPCSYCIDVEHGKAHNRICDLVASLRAQIPEPPMPIETAPHGKNLWLLLITGETVQGKIRNHNGDFLYWEPSENSLLYDELFDSVLDGAKLQINRVTGWTPVKEAAK